MTLYAASSDGTLGVFNFDPEELEGIAPHSVQEQYFQKFAFTLPPLPEGYANIVAPYQETSTVSSRITPPPSPTRAPSANPGPSQSGFGADVNGSGEVINKLVAKRGKKAKPGFANALPASIPSAFGNQPQSASAFASSVKSTRPAQANSFDDSGPSRAQYATAPPRSHRQTSDSIIPPVDNWPHTVYDADVDMDMEVPIDSLSTVSTVGKGKRKGSGFEDDSRPTKARTLGGDRAREAVTVRELGVVGTGRGGHVLNAWSDHHLANVLPVPHLLSVLTVKMEGSDDILEAKNSEGDSTSCLLVILVGHSNPDFQTLRKLHYSRASIQSGWISYRHEY